jgi:hypothetical protein
MATLHNVKDAGSWCPRCPKKHESLCGEALDALFPENEFVTTRAIPWLKLGKGGYPLELDFYCEALGLAVEYNGRQHYEFDTFFHADPASFERRLELDRLKAEACEENWVTLVVVPYTVAAFRNTPESKREAIVSFLREKWRSSAIYMKTDVWASNSVYATLPRPRQRGGTTSFRRAQTSGRSCR